jgi:hypothetical protein
MQTTSNQPFNRAEHMTAVTWDAKLDAVQSEYGVVMIARDFAATLDPWEIACLPEACRPAKITDANDVAFYAFLLMRHQTSDDPRAAAILERLAAFFSTASIRLSQILATSNQPEESRGPAYRFTDIYEKSD